MTDEELLAYRTEVSRLLAATVDLEADRDRARDAAVALEQENAQMRKHLTLLFIAAEAMEDDADAENRSSRALADLRRIMNGIPADALNEVPFAEVAEPEGGEAL